MCHLAFGLIFAIWSLASFAMESGQDVGVARLDLVRINLDFARGVNPERRSGLYKFTASVLLAPAPDDAQNVFAASGATPGMLRIEPTKEVDPIERIGLRLSPVSNRPYLSPLLSFESPGQKLNLRVRRHGFWFQYRQDFH